MDDREREARDQYTLAFQADMDEIIVELVEHVKAQLPEYRYLVETLRDKAFERNLRKHFVHFVDNVRRAAPVVHHGKDHLGYATALQRAEEGFPLASILRTYQYATRAIWSWTVGSPALADIRREAVEVCWPQWLDYVDAATSATSEAYVTMARRRAEEDALERRRLLEGLLSGTISGIEAERSLAELGAQSWPGFVVVVLRSAEEDGASIAGGATSVLKAIAQRQLEPRVRPLALRRDHELVVVLPGPRSPSEDEDVTESIRTALAELASAGTGSGWFGAVSDAVVDIRDVPLAYARTTFAARAAGLRRDVLRTSDLHLIDHALTAVHLDFERVCPEGLVEFFAELGEGHSDWVGTIIAWMESGLNASAAAKRLGVHSNTVYYRLAQIESRSGLDLRDFSHAFDLYAVARMRAYLSKESPPATPQGRR